MKITFRIENQKYEIRPMTIGDNYKIQKELTINPNPGFLIVSILSGCPEASLRMLGVSQWNELWGSVGKLIQYESMIPEAPSPIVNINGNEYGLLDFDNMTIGEFADLDLLVNGNDSDSRLHEALAILYRPVTEKQGLKYSIAPYDLESYKERASLFLEFPLKEARKAMGFFLLIGIQSTKDTLISLEKRRVIKRNPEVMEQIKSTKNHLQELGTEVSSRYAVTIPSNWKELRSSELKKPLTFSSIWKGREGKEKRSKMTKLIIKE